MDDFFQKLTISNKEDLLEAMETGRQKLGQIKGDSRIEFALWFLKWIEKYPLLTKYGEEVINDVLELAKETSTEHAAILLTRKAFYQYLKRDLSEATHYADLALKKSRDIGSNKTEVDAMTVKGLLCDVKMEYKKSSAWYTRALAKCPKFQRPDLMLNIGKSLSKQGEYSQAWSFFNQAKSLASDLSNDLSQKDLTREYFKRIVAKAYLRISQVYESLEDFDAALRTYDKGISLCMLHGFTNEIFQMYRLKGKVYSRLGSVIEAETTWSKAVEAHKERVDNDPVIYMSEHEMAHRIKNAEQYEEALLAYRQILFEDNIDAQTGFKRLNDFMDNNTNIFLEIVQGIAVCLNEIGRVTESETINKEEALFSELKQQIGIYTESDRNYKLRIRKNSLCAALRKVFFTESEFVEYKNIQAIYDPQKDKATFKVGEKEIRLSRRYFLVFKCLVDNAGEPVSGEMLNKFVIDQGEAINEKDSGLRTYVGRLKKEVNLAQFLEPKSKYNGKGWKLKAP